MNEILEAVNVREGREGREGNCYEDISEPTEEQAAALVKFFLSSGLSFLPKLELHSFLQSTRFFIQLLYCILSNTYAKLVVFL